VLLQNPYRRISDILENVEHSLGELSLKEPQKPDNFADRKTFSRYHREKERWQRDLQTAHALGWTIRMHAPVRLEAFINLVIFVLQNDTLRGDRRLFESRVREQVDLRVRSLHINCEGFARGLDIQAKEFLDFTQLMNERSP
jgi:hypothetical protein